MKNKIYKISIAVSLFIGTGLVNVACTNDNIEDVKNLGAFDTENFFRNEQECFFALVGTYDPLRKYAGGFENMVTFFNAGSDDFYAGGGSSTDGAGIQGLSNYQLNPNTMPASYWRDYYQGISRANVLVEKIPQANMSDAIKNRFMAESKTLRALYYFELVRMFKNIPLILTQIKATDDYYNIPQANPTAVYTQIEADLLAAIPNLPMTVSGDQKGRLTQGAARALLGKVYLYQNKKSEAAAQFAEVNGTPGGTSQYGYKLVANFEDLWKVGAANQSIDPYKFSTESIIEVMHTNKGNSDWGFWGQGNDEGNSICIMTAPRSYVETIPNLAPDVVSGWAFNPVTQDLFNFMQGDPRLDATILNIKALKQSGIADYSPAYMDSGYFLNKYMPTKDEVTTLPGAAELNYRQNYIYMRLADTYLMEAEALNGTGARAQALLDAVRARVGLASVPVSIQAIKDERRRELAGEGHRWFDLVRWGDAPSKLASRGFVAGKNEILPIPYTELTGTILHQNPGY
ncbi:RagB/SusD family nutrient uptake outer membrane protein [Chryseobacterium daecheongense]|uniref:RagB/SusD family nutrient uptake outer membrane protein n=1 Tax=Chryseobacterium daecheongense TaxID=192389 RepID=UPI001FD70A41|nr:RagB/SusD family nutrient uptake outer membrane protein [Chryseobacterium daecheongense]UOU97720.1 RagB/SusD family nutrient uptake outer membrane protein [Chryseobacterium daecheongense]